MLSYIAMSQHKRASRSGPLPDILTASICLVVMQGGDTEVSILGEVEVMIVAEDVPEIVVGVVVAELTLWMALKSPQAIVFLCQL